MARKLDARAASFTPSVDAPPPQQQARQEVGASASNSAAHASNKTSSQGWPSPGHGKPPPSAEATNGRTTPATRSGGGQSRGGLNSRDGGCSNRSTPTVRPQQAAGGRGGGGVDGGGRGARRRMQDSSGDKPGTDAGGAPNRRSNADGGGRRSASGASGAGGGRSGSSISTFATDSTASVSSGGTSGKGRGKGGNAKGGNANHLLNFQFQPISNAAHQGEGGGGRARRGSGGGGGSGRSKGGGGGIWGGGSTRGPMSKEQFLQANFHFLLHNSAGAKGDASSTSPNLQEAFFDPDVLVDWETVDTVRLFRKVLKRKKGLLLPSAGKKAGPTDASIAAPGEESSGSRRDTSSPEFDGLTVMPAVEEVTWERGKYRRDAASSGTKASQPLKPPAQLQAPCEATLVVASSTPGVGAGGDAVGAASASGGTPGDEEEEEAEDGEWRCSICLGAPIVPRVTKCGHGPFCLVCILRHLHGETSARCPLCFDKMQRAQLRRVACHNVRPYIQGGGASLLLLQRERSSLVPTVRAFSSREDLGGGVAAAVPRGSRGCIPGRGVKGAGDTGEENWAAGVCPSEGDQSERFSRLVRANPSTLRDLATAEQFALLSFRHDCIQSGETEWIPYVSEAQALVNEQLERLSSSLPNPPAPAPRAESGRSPRWDVGTGSAPVPGKVVGSASPHKPAGEDKFSAELHNPSSVSGTAAGSSSSSRSDAEKVGVGVGMAESAPTGGGSGDAVATSEAGLFRFFQSSDGQKAFLHPLNMRQLLDDSEKGLPLPERVDAKVLEVETVKLTPELRRRLPFLSHLPIHCDVSFLEVDMAGLVTEETTHKFREEIQKRERKRRARAAQEARAAKKEARLEQNRTDRIAAMREFTVDLQGPIPGGSESPRPPPLSSAAASSQDPGSSEGDASGVEAGPPGGAGVAAPSAVSGAGGGPRSSAPSNGASLHRDDSTDATGGAARGNGQEATGWSFARVTAMNGHFPTLKPSAESVGGGDVGTRNNRHAGGAWGASAAADGGNGRPTTVWGAKVNEPVRRPMVDAVGDGTSLAERESGAPQSSGKKKGRKGKAVSLFSNAGVRGGAR
eukprot:g7512.t1